MFLIASLCLGLSTFFLISVVRVRGASAVLLALLVVAAGQIVLLSELLSELKLLSARGYLVGHVAILIGTWIGWRRRGDRGSPIPLRVGAASLLRTIRRHPILCAAGAALSVIYLGALISPYFMPIWIGDVMSYHLPRAYFWLELGTARHFHTGDFRMTEFPPNSAFFSAWMMAFLGRGTPWLHVPQWLSAVGLGVGAVALARALGFARAPSACAGMVAMTPPIVVAQTATAQNDLVSAVFIIGALVFAVRFMRNPSSMRESWQDAAYAGVAFGLAVGTKLLIVYLVPVLGLAVLVLGFASRSSGRAVAARAGALVAAQTAGVLLFGSYNIFLNLLAFGHPFMSAETTALLRTNFNPHTQVGTVNFVRLFVQLLDWPGLALSPNGILPELQRKAVTALGAWSGLPLFAGPMEPMLSQIGAPSVSAAQSGLGPVAFLLFALSFPAALALSVLGIVRRRAAYLAVAALLAAPWFLMAGIAWTRPWTLNKTRYFIVVVPIVAAIAFPLVYRRRMTRRLVAAPALAVSLWIALHAARAGHEEIRWQPYAQRLARPGESPLNYHWGGIQARQLALMRRNFAPGASIGVDVKVDIPLFNLLGGLPELSFSPIPVKDIVKGLSVGSMDAGLLTRDRAGGLDAVPLVNDLEMMLLVRRPLEFIHGNLDLYGLVMRGDGADWSIEVQLPAVTGFTGSAYGRWIGPALTLHVPTGLFEPSWREATVMLRLEQPAPAGLRITASCGGEATTAGTRVSFRLRRDCFGGDAAFQKVGLQRRNGDPAGTIRIIGLWMTNLLIAPEDVDGTALQARLASMPASKDLPWPSPSIHR